MKSIRIRRDALPDHPWVYKKQILRTDHGTRNGDPVRIRTKEGAPVGAGLYNGQSQIALRILSRDPSSKIDRGFLEARIGTAVRMRRKVLGLDKRTNAWRVINSEGDGLSGLVVDRYADVLVAQVKCLGIYRFAPEIMEILEARFRGSRIRFRRDAAAEKIEGFRVPDPDGPPEVEIKVDDVRMVLDLEEGHKTGTFLDQRDNRLLAASVAPGREVLDLFCYEGGFALACAKAGAKRVRGVDLDEKAVARARSNATRNGVQIGFEHGDAFEVLRGRPRADMILLDPPKWISSREDEEAGRRRYLDLNALAIEALRPGGLLLTSSCSGRLSESGFLEVLRRAAARAGKGLKVIEVRGPAPDHPVPANFPEGRYLSCVLAAVTTY